MLGFLRRNLEMCSAKIKELVKKKKKKKKKGGGGGKKERSHDCVWSAVWDPHSKRYILNTGKIQTEKRESCFCPQETCSGSWNGRCQNLDAQTLHVSPMLYEYKVKLSAGRQHVRDDLTRNSSKQMDKEAGHWHRLQCHGFCHCKHC